MHVRTEVTELIAHTDVYTYRVRQYKGKWTVVRVKTGSVWIPPLMDMLTLVGWVNVISATNRNLGAAQFDSDEQALLKAFEA